MANESKLLSDLIEANKRMLRAREAFFEQGENKGRSKAISAEVDRAMGADAAADAGLRLILAADLLVEVPGPESVKSLLRILGHEDPGVRVSAGEALVEVLADRWGEASRAVEAALSTLATEALRELPFVLAETGEPGGGAIIAKLLAHSDADVAASAIEALVELGDGSHLDAIKKLVGDTRPLTAEEQEGEEEAGDGGTLGELASDAVDMLST